MSSYSLERENKINLAVDLLLNDFNFVSTPQQFASQDNFYVYKESSNIYELDAEMFIADKLDELYPNTFNYFSHKRDVINRIQQYSQIKQPDSNLVHYNNGIYDKRQNKLLPYSLKHFTVNKINLNYIEQTKPNFDKYAYLNYIDYGATSGKK